MGRENIPGRDAYLWIYDEWLKTGPRPNAVVVEVGVALGKSVSYIAERLIEMGRRDVQVYAVDPWAGTDRNGEQSALAEAVGGDFTLYCKYMMANAPAAFEFVRPLRMRGDDAAIAFSRTPRGPVDLVVLDGAHDFETVRREIVCWRAIAGANWIGGDDYMPDYQGVIDAAHEAFGRDNIDVRHDPKWEWGTWLWRGSK